MEEEDLEALRMEEEAVRADRKEAEEEEEGSGSMEKDDEDWWGENGLPVDPRFSRFPDFPFALLLVF